MFNNKKNSNTLALTEPAMENITTIIAEDCNIGGLIDCKAYIKIDGQVMDSVKSLNGIVLGQKGYIKGDAKAKEIIIHGKIEGNVFADSLVLKSTGIITGNIQVKTLQIEAGATYKGSVNMESDVNFAAPNNDSDE